MNKKIITLKLPEETHSKLKEISHSVSMSLQSILFFLVKEFIRNPERFDPRMEIKDNA